MRKVLSLIVVLGLTSVAGANMVWIVGGNGITDQGGGLYTIEEFTTGTVQIIADFTVESIDVGAISVDNTDASVANHGVADVGVLHTQLTYRPPSSNGIYKADDGNVANIVIYQMGGGVNIDNPDTPEDESLPVPIGEVLYSFDVTAGAEGTAITIDDFLCPSSHPINDPCLNNPYGPYPIDTALASEKLSHAYDIVPLTLAVVPEPATVALLGLGMLTFLRKK